MSKPINNIDTLIKKYGDLSLAEASLAMAYDKVGEAEARAMLAKQGYSNADVDAAIKAAQNRIETEKNTQAKIEQAAAENQDAKSTQTNTNTTNIQTTAIKAETQAIKENTTAKAQNAMADNADNISDLIDVDNPIIIDKDSQNNKNNQSNKILKESLDDIDNAAQSTAIGMGSLANSVDDVAIASTKASVGTKLLTGAFNLLKGVGVTLALSLGLTLLGKFITAQKELAEATKSSAQELSDEKEQINDYVDKYNQLHEVLLQAKDDEEKTYEVKQELLTLQEELNEKYGEEYGKLNLVANGYKNVADEIENLSKKQSEQWLNKNQKGYEQAVDALNKVETTYLTGELNIASITPELDALSKEFEDRGIIFDKNTKNGTYRIRLTANAEDAVDVLNDFMPKLRDIYKSYPDDSIMAGYFNQILKNASSALNDRQSIIDQYSQARRQGQLSEIATNEKYAASYDELIEKQQTLKEAILNNNEENPFDNIDFENAYEEYKAYEEKLLNDSEMGQFKSVIKEVTEELGLEIYDFQNKLLNTTDQGIQNALSTMKGMTDVEIESLFDSLDNETATTEFEKNLLKIKDAAEEDNLSISNLITILGNLGYVLKTVSNEENTTGLFDEKSISETISILDEMSEKWDEVDNLYTKYKENVENGTKLFDVSNLQSLSEQFSDVNGVNI